MGLHIVIMAITIGGAASGTPAHAAPPALVAMDCPRGAVLDLRVGTIRCEALAPPVVSRTTVPRMASSPGPRPAVISSSTQRSAVAEPAQVRPTLAHRRTPAAAGHAPEVHPAVVSDGVGVHRASAEAPQTMADSFLHPKPTFYDVMDAPPPPLPPATGGGSDAATAGPSIPAQVAGGLGEGMKACARGAAIGAVGGAVGAAGLTVVSGGAAAPSVPFAAAAGGLGGCATGIAGRLFSAF